MTATVQRKRPDFSGPRRYFIVAVGLVAAFLVFYGSALCISYRFLLATGEYTPMSEVVSFLKEHGGLWQQATRNQTPAFKLEAYRQVMPEIVAFGSSRTNNIHSGYFSSPYVGMGNAGHNLVEIEFVLRQALAYKSPSVLILGVDETFFLPLRISADNTVPSKLAPFPMPNLSELRMPLSWILEKKLSLTEFRDLAWGRHSRNPSKFGVRAVLLGVGFDFDGSQYEVPPQVREPLCSEDRFATYTPMALYRRTSLSPEAVDAFKRIVSLAKEHRIELVTFTPPYSSSTNDRLKTSPFAVQFIAETDELVKQQSKHHFNFRDVRSLSSTCEFLDAQHGGDVTYARILKLMAIAADSPLASFVNIEALDRVITRYSGSPTIPHPRIR